MIGTVSSKLKCVVVVVLIAGIVGGCGPQAAPPPAPEDNQRALQMQIDNLKKSNIPQADKERAIASLEAQMKKQNGAPQAPSQ